MNPADAHGEVLAPLVDAALRPEAPRDELYRALLEEPLCLAHLGPDVPAGSQALVAGQPVRLVEAPELRVPVVPLYVSGAAMAAAGQKRNYWPDGVERGVVLENGEAFARLRGHPGAVVVVDDDGSLPLDAGEIAALAERVPPPEYIENIRALVKSNKGRHAVQRLAKRPLYVLGHPQGGLLMMHRDIPAFFHLAAADRFAARIASSTGEKVEHGLVSASDLFKNAYRGKLALVIDPGPESITLRWGDMRF